MRELVEGGYRDLAYTTVMTTLDRLFKKGLLRRSEEGRAFRYAPRLSREEMHREAASHAATQARDRYRAGTITQLDLLQAQRDAFNAEVSRIQADADLVNARAQLRLASGNSLLTETKGTP